jgi:glycosyltransferase involved in cell wall biosynthesis
MSSQEMKLKTYTTSTNEELLYAGEPNMSLLEDLAKGPGDIWHSSLDQGFKNCFKDIIYQTAVYWWFLNDIETADNCVNWRVNSNAFVIRKSIWEQSGGFNASYDNPLVSGLDFGFNTLRYSGGVPLYIKGLFKASDQKVNISSADRYLFFLNNFKKEHAFYMMFRKGLFSFFSEYSAYSKAKQKRTSSIIQDVVFQPKPLKDIQGKPTVSLVIPTMKRQAYTELLLQDHNQQTYLIKEAVIVDATPEHERDDKYYNPDNFDFDIKVKWQTSKGSCRARNEAIAMCTGDYVLFADDDIRILPDFVENHIKFLQTNNALACNGLDIMAEHVKQDLSDLKQRLEKLGAQRWKAGVSQMFSNANSIVKRSLVEELIGNDINFDGGYGEDSDFGLRILNSGNVLMYNPFSPILHLKPPQGGYRFWGQQSKQLGKKRKTQPWELDKPVKFIRPVPSPTITYGIVKHYKKNQIVEWQYKHFFLYLFKGSKSAFLLRFLKLPYKILQFKSSLGYAKRLMSIGERYN